MAALQPREELGLLLTIVQVRHEVLDVPAVQAPQRERGPVWRRGRIKG